MEKCAAYLIDDCTAHKGSWREDFPGYKKLCVELGCGKGRFTADCAESMGDAFFLAVEKAAPAMIIAEERVRDRGIENVRFIYGDASGLTDMFDRAEVDRLYINFCDPWPKSRDAKFRLTAPAFLRRYGDILPVGGQIHFKTDNRPLFDWSIEQFNKEGWDLSEITNDLHRDGVTGIMTDYEAKFCSQGLKINRLVATRTDATLDSSAGVPPRLYHASLKDSRGFEESCRAAEADKDRETGEEKI
jgi:tRNA (guanine-N7-)-methyltransferase